MLCVDGLPLAQPRCLGHSPGELQERAWPGGPDEETLGDTKPASQGVETAEVFYREIAADEPYYAQLEEVREPETPAISAGRLPKLAFVYFTTEFYNFVH